MITGEQVTSILGENSTSPVDRRPVFSAQGSSDLGPLEMDSETASGPTGTLRGLGGWPHRSQSTRSSTLPRGMTLVGDIRDLSKDIENRSQKPLCGTPSSSIFTGVYNDAKVALKVLKALEDEDRKDVQERTNQEIQVWARLRHDNVVPFFGLDNEVPNSLAAVMVSPWYNNGHARDYIRNQKLSQRERVHLVEGVTEGLHYLHSCHIIHGDPKPENIYIDDDGRPRLADFGMSHFESPRLGAKLPDPSTLRYCAPELLELRVPVPTSTKASDMYSMGSVAMELILQVTPYNDMKDSLEIGLAIIDGKKPANPADHSQANDIEKYIWNLVERCWNQAPAQRPSAREFLDKVSALKARMDRPNRRTTRGQTRELPGTIAEAPMVKQLKTADIGSISMQPPIGAGLLLQYDQEPPNLTDRVTWISEQPIFRGNYSLVYKGAIGDERVAIKMIQWVQERVVMERKVKRESKIWWELVHPNILPLFGWYDYGDFGSLVSPWCEYGDALKYLKTGVDEKARVNLWLDVAQGIAFLHSRVVVHGDLKPTNVLVDEFKTGKICDFGLGREIRDFTTGLTTTTPHTGTTSYLSYELTVHRSSPEPASDVHALGCVGVTFLFDDSPYSYLDGEPDTISIPLAISKKQPPFLRPGFLQSSHLGDADPVSRLWDNLERCWNIDAEKRPIAADICRYLSLSGSELVIALVSLNSTEGVEMHY